MDRVVHLAFILGEPDQFKPTAYLNVQCMGTANVFEAARLHGVRRVVYASSVAVYGHNPPDWNEVTEDDAYFCEILNRAPQGDGSFTMDPP